MKLCFATRNPHKVAEVQALLGDRFELVGLDDLGCGVDLPETFPTLAENAAQKAGYVWQHYSVDCFADDTGLEVEALFGAPGVHSARYAGPNRRDTDNVQLLLENLRGQTNRDARFRTVVTLILNGNAHYFEGTVAGQITEAPRGSGGFGYDPIFQPEGFTTTFAEMSASQKNAISHRGRAVGALVKYLRTLGGND